jgi:RNase_H superfamily
MLSQSLRQRLSRLARSRVAGSEPPPPAAQSDLAGATVPGVEPARVAPAAGAEEASPVGERSPVVTLLVYDPRAEGVSQPAHLDGAGRSEPAADPAGGGASYFLIRPPLGRLLEDAATRAAAIAAATEVITGPGRRLALLDIETAGLTAAPLFLVGLLTLDAGGLALHQYFARDYTEEAAMLEGFLRAAGGFDSLVTFNGTSFDLPYILERATYHRLPGALTAPHLDLLPRARKRWRGAVPNCKLVTLENRVLGRCRVGDVPGSTIPQLYHDFVRTGNWDLLAPVFHHNALDLLAMAELLPYLLEGEG